MQNVSSALHHYRGKPPKDSFAATREFRESCTTSYKSADAYLLPSWACAVSVWNGYLGRKRRSQHFQGSNVRNFRLEVCQDILASSSELWLQSRRTLRHLFPLRRVSQGLPNTKVYTDLIIHPQWWQRCWRGLRYKQNNGKSHSIFISQTSKVDHSGRPL